MSNVVTSPRVWKRKAILIKAESQTGVDAGPSAASNWIEARNVSFQSFDAETVERNIEQPYFGNGGKLVTGKYSKLSFECALVGSGITGEAPKLAPLLRASAFTETVTANTSVVYSLISQNIGSVTVYLNIDGTLHKMLGCRANSTITVNSKGIPLIKFELESIFTAPSTENFPETVNRDGWKIERPVTAATTSGLAFNGATLACSALELNLGNQLARLDMPGPQTEIVITNRQPACSATVLAPSLTAFDPFVLANDGTVVDLSTTQDDRAGHQVSIDAKVRVIGVEYDQIEQMLAYKLTLEPTPVAGNDELKLTYL